MRSKEKEACLKCESSWILKIISNQGSLETSQEFKHRETLKKSRSHAGKKELEKGSDKHHCHWHSWVSASIHPGQEEKSNLLPLMPLIFFNIAKIKPSAGYCHLSPHTELLGVFPAAHSVPWGASAVSGITRHYRLPDSQCHLGISSSLWLFQSSRFSA